MGLYRAGDKSTSFRSFFKNLEPASASFIMPHQSNMRALFMKFSIRSFLTLILVAGLTACATTSYLKGVDSKGSKVYLGNAPTVETESYKTFIQSQRGPVQEQQYFFQRLKEAPKDLQYYHDGNWYGWVEAYRGGMWLVRNRYEKGQDTRTFLKKYVLRSEGKKELHLIKYPDGSVQIAYDVLLNELDWLEEKTKTAA